jgi:feruloyl esterase
VLITVPAFCRVALTVKPAIKIEVWMPAENWNGNFKGLGNMGFAGSILYPDLGAALRAGYATASTDAGHQNPGGGFGVGLDWAYKNPGALEDFAYRGVHEMTAKAKQIVESFYGNSPHFSYFEGCSGGGRMSLMEAERYPEDYNGIVAGAPQITSRLIIGVEAWSRTIRKDPESEIPANKEGLLADAVLAACDAKDGVKDGIISDPQRCHFDPATLLCNGADSATCLTAKQVETAKKVYAGPPPVDGKLIAPGFEPGSERNWNRVRTPANPNMNMNAGPGIEGAFERAIVFEDQNYDPNTFDFDKDFPLVLKRAGDLLDAMNSDLSSFRSHGGKMIMYHGWTDPVEPPLGSVLYYKSVVAAAAKAKGSDVEDETAAFDKAAVQTGSFFRLYMVPGMDHCGGGVGPNTFDALGALANWVEHKQPPDRIVASHSTNNSVDRTRPLCPYPQTAQYTGKGSTDDAANFACKLPKAN